MLTSVILLAALATSPCERADAARIQQHLLATWTDLSARPPPGLTAAQREARRRNLDALHAYALRGVFPVNPDFARLTPYFIDARGTRCAMAHLIETAGGAAFVEDVARERNNAYVRELQDDPRLGAWLEANGLTVAEAARIQPSYVYCQPHRTIPACGLAEQGNKAIEATIVGNDGTDVWAVVDAVHGGATYAVGQQVKIGRSHQFAGWEDVYKVGARVFAREPSPGSFAPVSPIDTNGRVWFAMDRKCATRPSIDVLSALAIGKDTDRSACNEALFARDPAYAQVFCISSGFGGTSPPDLCLEDGGFDPAVLPEDAGVPDDAGAEPPQDAGMVTDAGGSGNDAHDAGGPGSGAPIAADAGAPGGSQTVDLPTGGCSAAPGAWLLALLAMTALALRSGRRTE